MEVGVGVASVGKSQLRRDRGNMMNGRTRWTRDKNKRSVGVFCPRHLSLRSRPWCCVPGQRVRTGGGGNVDKKHLQNHLDRHARTMGHTNRVRTDQSPQAIETLYAREQPGSTRMRVRRRTPFPEVAVRISAHSCRIDL